ncbi:MAG TPA: DoxX family protein [Longimicrobiales bacterium]
MLWALQSILAAIGAAHGWMYVNWSPATEAWFRRRRPDMRPVRVPRALRMIVGGAEILAAPGLLLPGLTGILPSLTPIAAAGFALIMAGAIGYHIMRREASGAATCAVLLLCAALVAYSRWRVAPL